MVSKRICELISCLLREKEYKRNSRVSVNKCSPGSQEKCGELCGGGCTLVEARAMESSKTGSEGGW